MTKKQSDDEFLIEEDIKTAIQIIYGKRLFDIFDKLAEVLGDQLTFDEINEGLRPDLGELND